MRPCFSREQGARPRRGPRRERGRDVTAVGGRRAGAGGRASRRASEWVVERLEPQHVQAQDVTVGKGEQEPGLVLPQVPGGLCREPREQGAPGPLPAAANR